jgi:Fe-S cluster biogenesis protein NfuA
MDRFRKGQAMTLGEGWPLEQEAFSVGHECCLANQNKRWLDQSNTSQGITKEGIAMPVEMTISHVEPTPNPNAFKFHTGELLVKQHQLNFPNAEAAEALPLAQALFEVGEVTAVLIAEDFVSVSGTRSTYWQNIREAIIEQLKSYDVEAATELANRQAAELTERQARNMENPLFAQVNDLFETFVRPALAGDGGGIELIGVDDNTVQIRYQGACGSCPTSTATTLNAIENLLHDKINPELKLVSV